MRNVQLVNFLGGIVCLDRHKEPTQNKLLETSTKIGKMTFVRNLSVKLFQNLTYGQNWSRNWQADMSIYVDRYVYVYVYVYIYINIWPVPYL